MIQTSDKIWWSGTNTVVLSIDYNADTGATTFILYTADKSSILTQGTTTFDAQTRAAIGPDFRVEMGMDGYNSADDYWDYVEVKRLPVFQDEFGSTTPNAALDPTKWTIFTDTDPAHGPAGGDVYQSGDGWAHVDVMTEHTGTGFFTARTFANAGQYHIEGKVKFTQGTNNADNIFMLIRNADNSTRSTTYYMTYIGPQVRFDIHPTHSPMQGGFTSVHVQTNSSAGWQYPPTSTSNDISWAGTSTVIYSIDYNADTGQVNFKLYNEDKTQVRTEVTFTLDSQIRAEIGANFRVEMGMDGYNSSDHFWDYVRVYRTA
jgi:hypothetical protein